jgi:hypothetical protein
MTFPNKFVKNLYLPNAFFSFAVFLTKKRTSTSLCAVKNAVKIFVMLLLLFWAFAHHHLLMLHRGEVSSWIASFLPPQELAEGCFSFEKINKRNSTSLPFDYKKASKEDKEQGESDDDDDSQQKEEKEEKEEKEKEEEFKRNQTPSKKNKSAFFTHNLRSFFAAKNVYFSCAIPRECVRILTKSLFIAQKIYRPPLFLRNRVLRC